MTSWPLFQNALILRRPRVTSFAENIKVESTFIKASLKDSRKVERIKN